MGWVLVAARYPWRGAGMTEEVGAGMTEVGVGMAVEIEMIVEVE